MYSIFKTFVLSVLMVAQVHFAYSQNAAILPPAKTTFVDQNGKPLTSGTIDFYVPGTTTRKTTWQDSAATIANTNPVVLDGAGRGLILGNGAYRQIVKDRLGNTVWDQVTNSSGVSSGGSGTTTVGDGNAVGTVLPFSGLVAPSNYAFPYGQELSRTTYATLLTAITLTQNVTCVSGNPTITTVADTTQLNVGAAVEAACIPAGATILSKTVSTVTLTANASVSTTTSATFYPWGNGNGLTTFNAPDLRGVVLPGRNNMGGSSSVNLSSPYYTDPNAIAGAGGSQSRTLLSTNLPSYTPQGTNSTSNVPLTYASSNTYNTTAATKAISDIAAGTGLGTDRTLIAAAQTFTGTSINGGIAVSATVAAGGAGYTAGTQLLTVAGGTCTTQPQFNITTSAGAITAPVLVTAGVCSITPSNPAATTGGGGAGGTLTIIYSAVPLSVVQPSKTINYIVKILPDVNLSIARCSNLIDAGTACTANLGTSGNTIPLNNTANTFSAAQTFTAGVAISGGATSITALNTPTNPTDAATKAYVDSVATGLNILAQSRLATAAVLPNTPTYANGALGVGATLTAGSNTTLTVDGSVAALNDVILVKNQASAFQNGVYTVTTVGSGGAPWVLTRATYFDQAAEMKAGSYTLITAGSVNVGTSWALQTAVTTVGTDSLTWIQFSATAGVTSVGGFNGIVTAAQVTSSCNIFTGSLSGCVPSGSGTTAISQLIPTTQAWTTPTSLVVQTRAAAAALNLTGVNVVKTLGYATAGDGGGATFKNVGSTAFRDSFVTAVSLTGNGTSGCTNGTYRNKQPTGGTGTNLILNMVVSGSVVTSVTIEETGGNGYTAADVLTTTVTGCLTSVTVSVTTVSTPTGSFSDAASNHFQIKQDEGNWVNIRQFGAKVDYAGTDGTATNDFSSIQNAISYAADIHSPTIDGGGSAGTRVILPAGNALICGGVPLNVPNGVAIEGANMWASTIKICAAWGATANFINICDPDTQASCFASYLRNFTLYAPFNLAGNAGVSAIYSNSIQQVDILDRVAIYSGRRHCLRLETGYGGAALLGMQNLECTPGDTSTTNSGIYINYGTTLVTMRNVHVETSGPNTMFGIEIIGGFVDLVGFHTEGISTGIKVNIPTTFDNGIVRLHNLSGGASCTSLVSLDNLNKPGNTVVGQAVRNGCTNTVTNAQPAGAGSTATIVIDTIFNP